MGKEELTLKPLRACDVIEIRVWSKKKISIIKPLIPLRIAQILWAGGGQIIVIFYSVILKQRGLTLLEVSFIFSVLFLFQFAFASIAGIIADRIGHAKPVLLVLVLGTLTAIICILIAPKLRSTTCTEQGMSISCNNCSKNFCNTCYENYKLYLNSREHHNNSEDDFIHIKLPENFSSTINHTETDENYFDLFNLNSENTSCTVNCSLLYGNFLTNTNACLTREKILLTFYYIIILCLFSFWSIGNRFFDFVALSLAEEYGSEFGKEAFIATFGEFAIVAVAAFALNFESSEEKKNNYDMAYGCCAVAVFLTLVSVYYIKNVKTPPGRKLWRKARELICNTDTLVFIIVIFIAGNGFSFNVNFHLWFLEYINAPKVVIALHSLTSSFYGILVLFSSKWWIKWFGTEKIFVLGLLSYAANDIGYSFLYNPWLSLLLEATTMFSYHLTWIAFVIHCNKIAPKGLTATLNAVAGTVHYGIGRSTAILGGGLLMNYCGARIAYRVFACIYLVTAIFYLGFLIIWKFKVTKKSKKKGEEVEEMKHMNLSNEQEI